MCQQYPSQKAQKQVPFSTVDLFLSCLIAVSRVMSRSEETVDRTGRCSLSLAKSCKQGRQKEDSKEERAAASGDTISYGVVCSCVYLLDTHKPGELFPQPGLELTTKICCNSGQYPKP